MTPVVTPPSESPAPGPERRIAPRRQPAMGTIYQLTSRPGGRPTTGLVWNISASGLSMLVHEPRDVGTLLTGALETVTGGHRLAIAMNVVHVKLLETGDYFLGAHFTRQLANDELSCFVA